jgi:hypothetical protein
MESKIKQTRWCDGILAILDEPMSFLLGEECPIILGGKMITNHPKGVRIGDDLPLPFGWFVVKGYHLRFLESLDTDYIFNILGNESDQTHHPIEIFKI